MTSMDITIATKICRTIERSGFRRVDVARRTGVPPQRITEWCDENSKRRPTLEQAMRLARTLRVPLEWLADPEAGPEPPVPAYTEGERIVLSAYRRTGLAPDEAVRWLWLGRDAQDKSVDNGGDLPAPPTFQPRKHA